MPLLGNKEYKILNKSVPRIDGLDKVTGRAKYAADRFMEGMLYAGVKRSGRSSARVIRLDASRARAVEGVAAVVTFEELPKLQSWAGYMYLTGHIKYQGDCVAMVAAESRAALEEALAAIEVEYEDLPGVYEIDDTLAEGAPVIHEKYPGNILSESHFSIRKGDIEKGFARAEVIIEREYRTQYAEHAYIEPEAVLAYPNPADGVITLRASCQNPFFTRRYAADILGVPMNQVRLYQETLGGSFGGKEEGVGLVAARAAYLARLTDRPVKFVFSRKESFLESSKRHPFRLRYKIGATRAGQIVAFEGEQVDNSGAYNNQTQFMNWRANVHSSGPYEIENIKTDTYGVFTNNIHSGAFRGYSSPSLIFGQEQLIDELAEELGLCEVELRRINCLKDGSSCSTGEVLHDVILQEVMDHTVAETDYLNKKAEYARDKGDIRRGIGLAICYRGCGLGAEAPDASGAMVIANEDGSVLINSGLAENGQGLKTAYAQVAAEALGLPYESIRFYGTDTHSVADSGMTVASRGTVMGAQSMLKAAGELRRIMIVNALELGVFDPAKIVEAEGLPPGTLVGRVFTPEEIQLENGFFFVGRYPAFKVPFAEVCGTCLWTGRQMAVYQWFTPPPCPQDHHTGQGKAFPTYAYGCVVAEVEVDLKTGYVDLKKVTASHDVGTAVNPALIEGQIYGGIVMGQGYGIMEEVELDEGKVLTHNLDSYIIPTALDMPEMKVNIFECGDPSGTFGAKSVGEPSTEAVAAAIANAVYQATGRRIRHNPASLENVLLGKKLRK